MPENIEVDVLHCPRNYPETKGYIRFNLVRSIGLERSRLKRDAAISGE